DLPRVVPGAPRLFDSPLITHHSSLVAHHFHPAVSPASCSPRPLRLRAACSTCRVATRFWLATWSRFFIAWLICAMPVACWPAEATICAEACAASSSASPSEWIVWFDWPPALIAAATPLVTSSVERTAALVAFWISPRIWRTCVVAFFDWSARLLTSP